MKPFDYYKTLSRDKRKVYAEKAGTTLNYLVVHVFRETGQTRRPSNELLVGLVAASEGNVSLDEAIDYFLVQPVKKLAAELGQSAQQAMSMHDAAEVKPFDSQDKPCELQRRVGVDEEQMQVGICSVSSSSQCYAGKVGQGSDESLCEGNRVGL